MNKYNLNYIKYMTISLIYINKLKSFGFFIVKYIMIILNVIY